MLVTLNVPDHVRFQLVYRLERRQPFEVALQPPSQFQFLESPRQGVRTFREIASYAGLLGAAKSVAKLATARRSMYLVQQNGRAVSIGWSMIGKCAVYKIEPEAVVIGPIWTADEVRGQGLATLALQLAVNALIHRGRSVFYIDTENLNLPAQRVFDKCGFGGSSRNLLPVSRHPCPWQLTTRP